MSEIKTPMIQLVEGQPYDPEPGDAVIPGEASLNDIFRYLQKQSGGSLPDLIVSLTDYLATVRKRGEEPDLGAEFADLLDIIITIYRGSGLTYRSVVGNLFFRAHTICAEAITDAEQDEEEGEDDHEH